MRKLIGITTAVLAAAVLVLPATASAGVIQFSGSWTDSPTSSFMGDFACTGQPSTVAGSGLTSGSYRVTETVKLGAHVQLAIEGSLTSTRRPDRPPTPSSARMSVRGRTGLTRSSSGHRGVPQCSRAYHTERSCLPTAARRCSRSVSSCSKAPTARRCSSPRPPAAENEALALLARRPGHGPGLHTFRRRRRGSRSSWRARSTPHEARRDGAFDARDADPSARAVVDFVLTQTASVWHEFGVARGGKRSRTLGCWR